MKLGWKLRSDIVGYTLHPIDLAINKLLAVAGRDEPRDFLDIIDLHTRTLPIGALCWAGAGKDPGFTPFSLLEAGITRRTSRVSTSSSRSICTRSKPSGWPRCPTPTPSSAVVRRTRPGASTTLRVSQDSWRRDLTDPPTLFPITGDRAACSRGSSRRIHPLSRT